MLARFIRCRQEAIDSADYDRQERLDGASSDLLDEDDFTAYTRAARAQDDALRARVIAMPAPMIPFYCKECRAFTGNERHDHAQKGAQD